MTAMSRLSTACMVHPTLPPAHSKCWLLQLRERDWCNVITAHEGDSAAYTWRLSHLTIGEQVLLSCCVNVTDTTSGIICLISEAAQGLTGMPVPVFHPE